VAGGLTDSPWGWFGQSVWVSSGWSFSLNKTDSPWVRFRQSVRRR
jgi:hypothetical protein